jgi:hypothetical protein
LKVFLLLNKKLTVAIPIIRFDLKGVPGVPES